MNYITKIIIENFQSHKHTEIELSDGLNVIIGASDQGKTAIIRAVKWALYNEPRGTSFIRQDAKSARVSLKFSNGFVVTRERSSSKNRYILINPEGEKSIFEGFGNEIPKEILYAHGIKKILLDTDMSSAINMGEQLEGPFLLSQSGAIKAKAIGRIAGVHIIDHSIRQCVNDIKKLKQEEQHFKSEIENIDSELEKYEFLDELGNKINKRENTIKQIEQKLGKLEKLRDIKFKYKNLLQDIQYNKHILSKLMYTLEVETIYYKIVSKNEFLKRVFNTSNLLKNINKSINDCEVTLKATENIINGEKYLKILSQSVPKLSLMKNLKTKFKNIEYSEKNINDIIMNTKHVNYLINMHTNISDKLKLIKTLTSLRNQIQLLQTKIRKGNEILNKLDSLETYDKIVNKLSEKQIFIDKLNDMKQKYKQINESILKGEKYLNGCKNDLRILLNKYKIILKNIKKCPVCLNKIDDTVIENILAQYKEVF